MHGWEKTKNKGDKMFLILNCIGVNGDADQAAPVLVNMDHVLGVWASPEMTGSTLKLTDDVNLQVSESIFNIQEKMAES